MSGDEPKGDEPKGDEPKTGKCVICGKPQDHSHKPFCSKRCADVDLNRWLSGGYAIPAAEEDDPGDEAPKAPK